MSFFLSNAKKFKRQLNAHSVKINVIQIILIIFETFVKRVPYKDIFRRSIDYIKINTKESSAFKKLTKDFIKHYKILENKVDEELEKITSIDNALIFKRIGRYYIIAASEDNFLRDIVKDAKNNKNTLSIIPLYEDEDRESKVFIELNNRIKQYIEKTRNFLNENNIQNTIEQRNKENDIIKMLDFLKNDIYSFLIQKNILLVEIKRKKKNSRKLLLSLIFEDIIKLYAKCILNDISISFIDLMQYIFTKSNAGEIINKLFRAKKLGIKISNEFIRKYSTINNDINKFLDEIIKLRTTGNINIDVESFLDYFSLGGDIHNLVKAVINLRQYDDWTYQAISNIKASGGDIISLSKAINILKQNNINIEPKTIKLYIAYNIDIYELAINLAKAKKAKIDIDSIYEDFNKIIALNGNIIEFLSFLIKCKYANLEIDKDDFIKLFSMGASFSTVFKVFKIKKAFDLKEEKEFLLNIFYQGGDIGLYIDAISFAKRTEIKDINNNMVAANIIAGIDVQKILNALKLANKYNIKLTYRMAFRMLNKGKDPEDAVKKAIIPNNIKFQTENFLCNDGVSISFNIDVTYYLQINMFISPDESILKKVVTNYLIEEVRKYDSYKKVIEEIDSITKNTVIRINEVVDNAFIYIIKDMRIYNIKIEDDIKARITQEIAEHDKKVEKEIAEKEKIKLELKMKKAEVLLRESEAKINEGIASALEQGKLNDNTILKRKILFDDEKYKQKDETEDE